MNIRTLVLLSAIALTFSGTALAKKPTKPSQKDAKTAQKRQPAETPVEGEVEQPTSDDDNPHACKCRSGGTCECGGGCLCKDNI